MMKPDEVNIGIAAAVGVRGHKVSEKVERPTRKIAQALQTISEVSFVFPYTDKRPDEVEDIEELLRFKLDEINKLPYAFGNSTA